MGWLEEQPKYIDHYGQKNKKKDFAIQTIVRNHIGLWDERPLECEPRIMIEVKQLGGCESHVQKLDYDWTNLREGCYGNNFWVIYDYNRFLSRAVKTIDYLSSFCENLKKEVAQKGIRFEWIDFNDIDKYMFKYF